MKQVAFNDTPGIYSDLAVAWVGETRCCLTSMCDHGYGFALKHENRIARPSLLSLVGTN